MTQLLTGLWTTLAYILGAAVIVATLGLMYVLAYEAWVRAVDIYINWKRIREAVHYAIRQGANARSFSEAVREKNAIIAYQKQEITRLEARVATLTLPTQAKPTKKMIRRTRYAPKRKATATNG